MIPIVVILAIGVGYVGGYAQSATIVTPVTCPAEPEDAWIIRRIGYCDHKCIGAPYVADVTAEKTTCSCDRARPFEKSDDLILRRRPR
jgi:hypothetical protein